MSTAPVNAGSRFFIGGPVAEHVAHRGEDLTAADFADHVWIEVEGLEDLGRLRSTADPARHSPSRAPLNRATRAKSARWVDTYEPGFSLVAGAPGQAALFAAEASTDDFAFKIVLNDAPHGGTPSARIFIAAVAGVVEILGGPEDQPRLSAELWINSNVTRLDAAAPAED